MVESTSIFLTQNNESFALIQVVSLIIEVYITVPALHIIPDLNEINEKKS